MSQLIFKRYRKIISKPVNFCVTIEQILSAYGGVTSTEMLTVKKPIIGNVPLRRKEYIDFNKPTYSENKKGNNNFF